MSKTLDTKSLLVGILATLLVLSLISSKKITSGEGSNLEFIAHPMGVGVYNKSTKTIYLYKIWQNSINSKPNKIYQVSEEGSSLTEVE